MWLTDELLLYYQRCHRRSFLDVYGNHSWQNPPSDFLLKLQQDSWQHRQSVLAGQIYHQPDYPKRDWLSGARATLELMQQGVDRIYQGVLLASADDFARPINFGLGDAGERDILAESLYQQSDNPKSKIQNPKSERVMLVSNPHLLIKQPGRSNLGDWSYIPSVIKFGRRPKAEYQIVAAFHAQMLAAVQGVWPETAWLILRSKQVYALNLEKWVPQMQAMLEACIHTLLSPDAPEVFISRQRCSFCRWYSHCYSVAKSDRHLSLLPGVTPSRYQHLQSLGLTTVESLASALPSQLEPELSEEVATALVRQAQSVVQNRAILTPAHERMNEEEAVEVIHPSSFIPHPADVLPTAPVELYFDIEAQPELNFDYLLGVLVVDRMQKTQTFHPLLAEQPEDEELIWQQFLELVWAYPNAPIFHFSPYEADTVKRLSKLYKTPASQIQPVLSRFVDVHNRVMATVTLPVESYSLKSIASWLGFEWREVQGNGSQCIYWYDQWLLGRDRSFLEAILRYNEDDCLATHHVKDWLVNFLQFVCPQ